MKSDSITRVIATCAVAVALWYALQYSESKKLANESMTVSRIAGTSSMTKLEEVAYLPHSRISSFDHIATPNAANMFTIKHVPVYDGAPVSNLAYFAMNSARLRLQTPTP